MFRGPVMPLAMLISSPALWAGFVTGSLDLTTAITRFLIAVIVAAFMLSFLRSITRSYQRSARMRKIINAKAKADAARAGVETSR